MAKLPATAKRKAPTSNESAAKRPKRQSDLLAGFATQILKSPKKLVSSRTNFVARGQFEVDDEIEFSSDEERPQLIVSSQADKKKSNGKDLPSVKLESLELSPLSSARRSNNETKSTATQTEQSGQIAWLDRIPLRKTTDLAVHKKKVADVQAWIEASFRNVAQKTILVLTGPAGVGKTATVETLSHVLDFDIIEWKNPMSAEWSQARADREADSLAQKFERFLSVSDKYSALDFGDGQNEDKDNRRKVIVVEDIPNTFFANSHVSSARLAFQNSIMRYLSSPRGKYPLILIITETEPRGEDGDWNRFDAMSLRTLLNREILEARNCSQISFNEVAPTFISKALARLVDSLPRSEALDISQAVLDEIAQTANGDIRSAINTLQFISHRFSTHGRAPRARRKRKRAEVLTLSPEETQILNMITNRESALGYFHAIGKVIYNKRIPAAVDSHPYDALPIHLAHESRNRPESSVDTILDETSTDVVTFLQGVHQNYIPSTQTVEQADGVMHALSLYDVTRVSHTAGIAGVMGVMHALPQNVKRDYKAKVYFPAFKSLLRHEAEVRDELASYAAHAERHERIGRDLIDIVSYHSLMMQGRGEEGFIKAVRLDRASLLGRGGADSTQALMREDGDKFKRRHSNRQELKSDDVELSDEIEEVD